MKVHGDREKLDPTDLFPQMKTMKISLCLASLLVAAPSFGEVVIQDIYALAEPGNAATDLGGGVFGYEIDVTADFSAAGHGKLVMTYGGHGGGTGTNPVVNSVTYNGVPLIEAVQDPDNGGLVTAAIFYLDNVASDGILRIETSDPTVHYGLGLYAVDGLKAGVQDTGSARANSEIDGGALEVTMTTDEGFFVQEFARNNQSVTEDTEDAYETLYNISANSYRGFSQYRLTDTPGEYAAPVGNGGDNFKRIVTAAFEADPEASAKLVITSITPLGSDVYELVLTGGSETEYQFYAAADLVFNPGVLVENLSQGDEANDPGTVGGTNNSILTTDANGDGKVRVSSTGGPVDFVRAQKAPAP